MSLQEIELNDVGRLIEQTFEIAQTPSAVVRSHTGRPFQFGHRMVFGQLQKAHHHAQSLRTAHLVHRFGPSACVRPQHAASVQQVISASFDYVAFTTVKVSRIGRELASLRWRVQPICSRR